MTSRAGSPGRNALGVLDLLVEGRVPYLENHSQVIVPGMKHLITLPGMPL